jgi:hypothetical protein
MNLSDNYLKHDLIPYLTRIIKVDRGGLLEPTTSAMPMDLDIPIALHHNSFYTAIFDVYQDRRLRHNFNAQ